MSWVGFISPTQQPVGTRAGMVLLLLFSRKVMSDAWQHANGLQHARLPCPSLSPRICSSACPLSQRCHPTISLFVGPFSFCTQSFLHQGLSSKSPLCIRWPKYWSFSFSISPSSEYSALISCRENGNHSYRKLTKRDHLDHSLSNSVKL